MDITRKGEAFYGDSAYRSAATTRHCKEYGLKDRTMHKAQANRPLTKQQEAWNQARAKVRARVEHVFARIDLFWDGRPLRCTGLARATVRIGLMNLTHNLRRLVTKRRMAMGMV